MKYMVYTLVLTCAFIGGHITAVFHDHDLPVVTLLGCTDRTDLLIGDRTADPAVVYVVSRFYDGICKLGRLLLRCIDDVKGQALCALLPDTRKPGQLTHQSRNILRKVFHQRPSPPVSFPIWLCESSSALSSA